MPARVAIALSLVALAWAASARAADDPACARYHDALSYNLCLASHGPKANNIAKPSAAPEPRGAARGSTGYGRQTRASGGYYRLRGAQPARRAQRRMHMEFQVR